MSSQKGSGLWYLKRFPKLAKLFLDNEKSEGKEKNISEECRTELGLFCAASSKTLEDTGCQWCKDIASSKNVSKEEFWHICICLASSHGARNEQE